MNQTSTYPTKTADSVKGTLIFINSLFETVYPFSRSIPNEAMFAEAPIGVMFPPSVAPLKSPK